MLALVALTAPGPFAPRTVELGRYIGVRDDGALVAMAGERLHVDGHREISAVCTHPDHRGRGLAEALVRDVVAGVAARGEVPILHVEQKNVTAIRLYERLGFAIRRPIEAAVLEAPRS
jgi:predicted GNAT family acetyltransferase